MNMNVYIGIQTSLYIYVYVYCICGYTDLTVCFCILYMCVYRPQCIYIYMFMYMNVYVGIQTSLYIYVYVYECICGYTGLTVCLCI